MSPMLLRLRTWMMAVLLAFGLVAGGCASNGDPRDPLEPMNRAIYHFNDGVDHLLIKPAAELYQGRMIPQFVRNGLRNFFSNINDVIVLVNDILQGKFRDAESDLGRIVINSTAGILGFRDVAADDGLVKNEEDFGQTLGVWGFNDGPYIVLPILGPSSVRDTFGWVGDIYTWPITYVEPNHTRNTLAAIRFVGVRADLLAASRVLEAAALDPYTFTRDAYLQRRRNLVYDGRPPREEEDPEPKAKPGADAEPKSKPDASSSGVVPPFAAPFEGPYSLAPKPAPREPTDDMAANAGTKPQVVRVWLPSSSR